MGKQIIVVIEFYRLKMGSLFSLFVPTGSSLYRDVRSAEEVLQSDFDERLR